MKTQIFLLTFVAFLLSNSGCTIKTTTCTTKEQKKVKALKTELKNLNSKISSAKKTVKTTNSQISKNKINASKIEKQIKSKKAELNSLNSQIRNKKQELTKFKHQKTSSKSKTQIQTKIKTGKEIYAKCLACHGLKAEKFALGKSQVIAGWSQNKIINALNGYKNGTYGGSMASIMKGQANALNQAEIKSVAKYISNLPKPKSQKSFPSFSKSKSFKFKCVNLKKKQKFEISLNANKQVQVKTQGESPLLPIASWQKENNKYLTLIPEFDGSYSIYQNGNMTFASEFTDEVVDSTCKRIK
jgi:cytochrome c553